MFSKIFATAFLAMTFVAQAHAHAAIAPALGVAGSPARSDVQQPSTSKPCGNIAIASNLDTSTPVVANADGTFTVTVTDFNAGADGSRKVSFTVDGTATGSKFVAGTVSQNGNAAPTSTGSEQIVASLPAGTTCTGGASKNLCLASFKTTAGFGNCVVIQQSGSAAADTAAASTSAAANAATATVAAEASSTSAAAAESTTTAAAAAAAAAATTTMHHHHHHHHNATAVATTNQAKKQGGSRAARAAIFDPILPREKRGLLNWIWA
ncbi:hypothetical protein H0H93_001227 [Arthromyces matolae]|nr:hypothetical protein H0H93_001227 [Arthromyces matolae]